MTPCYSYYFCIFFIFRFFQIIMVSLFLARHDQHFILFKDLSIFNFQFTNFPSKTKYDNTVVITYSQAENKKKIVEKILWLNLLEAFFLRYTGLIFENWSLFLHDCETLLEEKKSIPILLSILNSINPSLQFTMEYSKDAIPFLDVHSRNNANNSFLNWK